LPPSKTSQLFYYSVYWISNGPWNSHSSDNIPNYSSFECCSRTSKRVSSANVFINSTISTCSRKENGHELRL
jgi:hypothetical protein